MLTSKWGDFSAREGTVPNHMTIWETAFADGRDAASIVADPPVYPDRSRRASILEGTPASGWRIGDGVARLQASKSRSGETAHGAVPTPQAPAWGTLRVLLGGNKNRQYCGAPARQLFGGPGRPLSGGSLPRRSLAGDAFRDIENKPLRTISNRNSNDSRKLATLSESTTSHFLIATKMHFSEEKAKREEKTNLVKVSKTIVLGTH
jgi:hypothetical protein